MCLSIVVRLYDMNNSFTDSYRDLQLFELPAFRNQRIKDGKTNSKYLRLYLCLEETFNHKHIESYLGIGSTKFYIGK